MKKILPIIIVALVVGAVAFYGGVKYGQSGNARGELLQGGAFRGGRTGQNGGFVSGDIISMDDKSITIKLRDGGSKIVFFASSTSIMKSTEGSSGDLKAGTQVTVMGNTNSDGSITAQSIQIRPGT